MQQCGLEVLLSQSQMEQKISGGLLRIADGKEVKGRRGGDHLKHVYPQQYSKRENSSQTLTQAHVQS